MRFQKQILLAAGALLGVLATLGVQKISEKAKEVPLPDPGIAYDENVNLRFRANLVYHQELVKNEDVPIHLVNWEWKLTNESRYPVEVSIPNQGIHVVQPDGRGYYSIPKDLIVDEPRTLKPKEELKLLAPRYSFDGKVPRDREYGFIMIAKVDSMYYVLGCAATVDVVPAAKPTSGQ